MNTRGSQPPSDSISRPSSLGPTSYRESSAWLVSLVLHLVLLLIFSLISIHASSREHDLVIRTRLTDVPASDELLQRQFHFDPTPRLSIGSGQLGGPLQSDLAGQLPLPETPRVSMMELEPQDLGTLEYREVIDAATGVDHDLNHTVRGSAGVGVTGADGAVDRITHEILLSLEERKTLVVWFFDQSGSLASQRQAIHARFHRIYEELGTIQAAGDPAFASHAAKPLLTSVVAFGRELRFMIETPTDDLQQIKGAVAQIEPDDSGIEKVFTSVHSAATRYRKYRLPNAATGAGGRNILFVVFTDEAGEDPELLDRTVALCRRLAIPVYVVGVPAPFGRRETLMKWVDPDPRFDQSPQWGRVDQGPESLLPERIKLRFAATRMRDAPIDSGFGPFALTRLCYETGGIYFAVHPNRKLGRAVSRGETTRYAAHLQTFFDPDMMRRYRPDYVSAQEYRRRVRASRARSCLVQAAELPWISPMANPRLRFVRRDEATFARALREAQKAAAKLEPELQRLYELLKQGEASRASEKVPRWQAGFDLAFGRVLAVKVRTEAYNSMLARAKRGMKFADPGHNTWQLAPSDEISIGSQLKTHAAKAREYLDRVMREHPGTPWAWLAQRELKEPLGWKWKESRTELNPPTNRVAAAANNAPRAPSDDRPRVIRRPPPRRPPPKL